MNISKVFTTDKIQQVTKQLKAAKNVVVVAHKSPDGDAVGSCLGLYGILKSNLDSYQFENLNIILPDPAPNFLNWLENFENIINFTDEEESAGQLIKDADIIFCLDFNVLHRVGDEMKENLNASKAFKIMIDHHLEPSDEFDVVFSDTTACSAAQLVFDFATKMNWRNQITPKTGEAFYCGIMTDTGSFRFPSTSAHTHEVIAALLELGVKNHEVHENVFDTNTVTRLKLRGYAINEKLEILEDISTAIISLSEKELWKYDYKKGDTEGLVNVGLSIIGINKAIFLKEMDGLVKISFRSKGIENPVNKFASNYFEGGGHANAAGGAFKGSLEEAITKLKKALYENYA